MEVEQGQLGKARGDEYLGRISSHTAARDAHLHDIDAATRGAAAKREPDARPVPV